MIQPWAVVTSGRSRLLPRRNELGVNIRVVLKRGQKAGQDRRPHVTHPPKLLPLPSDFVKLRHYGLLTPGHATTLLQIARTRLVGSTSPPPVDDFG